MMSDPALETVWGVYFTKRPADTDWTGVPTEHHHIHKAWDLKRAKREALGILKDMSRQVGGDWRRHGDWSTGVEIWEFPPGDHDFMVHPDRLVAYARWGYEDLTEVGDE